MILIIIIVIVCITTVSRSQNLCHILCLVIRKINETLYLKSYDNKDE